jgi:beta-phosphoglucomutase-like phosphatase (HAD superfamily)
VQPEQTLVVEDAPHGLDAARRAGAHLCRVAGYTEVDYWRIRASLDSAERRAEPEC